MKEENILYGKCKGCGKLYRRDQLVSTNIRIYGKGVGNIQKHIRVRLCTDCQDREEKHWESLEWDGKLFKRKHEPNGC